MLERNPADQEPDVDALTGTATTGHEWDGIRELNTPLPRWWLWLFYATIVWAVGYWIVYPAWPLVSSYTKGAFRWQSRDAVVSDLDALKAQRGPMVEKLRSASLQEIASDPTLARFCARAGLARLSRENCAPCHGAGGGGAEGYPNLNDDEWLWGGKLDEIAQTIRHGVRSGRCRCTAGRSMPAFGRDGILKRADVENVGDFVRSLSGLAARSQGRSHGRQEDLCRQLRGLPRRDRQGQPRARRAEPDAMPSGSTARTSHRSSTASGTAAAA